MLLTQMNVSSPSPLTTGSTAEFPQFTPETELSSLSLSATSPPYASPSSATSSDLPNTLVATYPTLTWREPPNVDIFNTILLGSNFPVRAFLRTRVTLTAAWAGEGDQGGILLWMPNNSTAGKTKRRWLKAGIQVVDGKACESVVMTDDWSDQSVSEIPDDGKKGEEGGAVLAIEIERAREKSRWKDALCVYVVEEGGRRRKIREVTWFFEGVNEGERMLAAMYANKPTLDERKVLLVRFDGFEVEKRGF